jgi:hypothetical protein
MRDVRKEMRSRVQYELDTGWTSAKFLTPNPALEGRVSKHKFFSSQIPQITRVLMRKKLLMSNREGTSRETGNGRPRMRAMFLIRLGSNSC